MEPLTKKLEDNETENPIVQEVITKIDSAAEQSRPLQNARNDIQNLVNQQSFLAAAVQVKPDDLDKSAG